MLSILRISIRWLIVECRKYRHSVTWLLIRYMGGECEKAVVVVVDGRFELEGPSSGSALKPGARVQYRDSSTRRFTASTLYRQSS